MKDQTITLPNGLRIILLPRPDRLSATVMVLVAVGSKYEPKKWGGISHFLEHLVFKGTTKRPKPSVISEELASLGAQSNAYTSQELTAYYATVEASKLPQAIEIVADMYLDPLLDETEINRERGVIIEEMNMYEDLSARMVIDHLLALTYGDQPAGRPVIGRKEVIKKLSRADIKAYRDHQYRPGATTVVVAGKFSSAEITKQLKRLFRPAQPGRQAYPKLKVKEAQLKPRLKVTYKKSDQTHLAVGFRSQPLSHPDHYPLVVLAGVLGGGASSRLFKKIRDELGAAYYVWAEDDGFTDHGLFVVGVGADTKRAPLIVETVLAECALLTKEIVGDQELKRVKDYLTGTTTLSLETTGALADFVGSQAVLEEKWSHPTEYNRRLQAVTAAEVKRVAQSIFKSSRLNLAVIGPFKSDRPFVGILQV
ncbi:MAG: hypothetical protein A2114_01880 [Candidatus Vogelbacteria bacterium GWA1_51_14]|uniref:Peptidase M16 n=1 Tax=Candidatus Vogelbacteria bacterium GWA1_51_14 TaxID=1802435 RepID=A0A1G2QAR9_9BACT|nr:MAG: hypothetical protein A2114_01880 [Candidatus Vogelbacteria bacterium GWA1_51_14]